MKRLNRIIIVGAGEAGRALLRDMRRRELSGSVLAFVDDNPQKIGTEPDGIPVLGPASGIGAICKDLKVTDVIIAVPSARPQFINGLITEISIAGSYINIYFVPSAEKFFDSVPIFPSIREFAFSDILDRNEFTLDLDVMESYFAGKSILVTGGGGSIGSEICRQMLKFRVKKIIAVGRGENSVYHLMKSMDEYTALMNDTVPELVYRVTDVRDSRLMERLFKEQKPDIVFHAAAHKHVPLMEFNGSEALQNNVLGTDNILRLSAGHGVSRFVLVSTDKAVRPANIMGATKRICELLTGYYASSAGLSTAIVRFGNVLGSRGSVIPLFMEQIEKGGPVTVTHPDVTRYFMSIPEASLLVINSAAISRGGEIFVLNMGEQYRIADVAKRLIELHGRVPGRDIKIVYTGLRPGEKMYEELFYDESTMVRTGNDSIFMLKMDDVKLPVADYNSLISSIKGSVPEMDDAQVREFIRGFVPEYDPSSAGSA